MMQEIAERSGNFFAAYIAGDVVTAGFLPVFSMAWSDTHGIADSELTVPRKPRKPGYEF